MPVTMILNTDDSFQPSNSVDLLQNRSRQISNQTLQSTQRMVGLVDQAQDTGMKTLAALDEQGEKLKRMDEINDEIREEIRQSEKVLSEMEKCCGLCVLPWKRRQPFSKADKAWNKDKDDRIVSEQPELIKEDSSIINDLPRITHDAVEEETNENLTHVHSTMRNLKNMAADMNKEVRKQNKHIDKLVRKADGNDQHVQSASQRTEIIRKS